ncbi:hypothetical protein VNO78_18250 [Psophocarpus tetragonolobus]|uniref:Uncharacterized protein n=1 Tax=Psophocarpus tetragonolobus TaxID=3891 RepID=A0AAN9SI11_PSOTE
MKEWEEGACEGWTTMVSRRTKADRVGKADQMFSSKLSRVVLKVCFVEGACAVGESEGCLYPRVQRAGWPKWNKWAPRLSTGCMVGEIKRLGSSSSMSKKDLKSWLRRINRDCKIKGKGKKCNQNQGSNRDNIDGSTCGGVVELQMKEDEETWRLGEKRKGEESIMQIGTGMDCSRDKRNVGYESDFALLEGKENDVKVEN